MEWTVTTSKPEMFILQKRKEEKQKEFNIW